MKEHVETLFIHLCFVGKFTYNCLYLVPLLVIHDSFLCHAQLPYNFSDKLHVTLCPALPCLYTDQYKLLLHVNKWWSNNVRSIVIFCKKKKLRDLMLPYLAHFSWPPYLMGKN